MPLGREVLVEACRQLALLDADLPGLHLTVNLSSRQLQEAGFVVEVRDLLAVHGIEPSRLTLEITERVAFPATVIALAG